MTPDQILDISFTVAIRAKSISFVRDKEIKGRIEYVCQCGGNRAGVRLLLACLLAKLDNPALDVRKPYTEIGTPDCFSGRMYDERFISPFAVKNRLPVNASTAFLTPALRNIDRPLSVSQDLVGTPRDLYKNVIQVLDDVATEKIAANTVLQEALRFLIRLRDENEARVRSLIKSIKRAEGGVPLSSENIAALVQQHLSCPHSSRLPTLVIAAAYKTVNIGEYAETLSKHNAADAATGALGDVEIRLSKDGKLATVYEIKTKCITTVDIDAALKKIALSDRQIDNYLFVTTETVDPLVSDYAKSFYIETGVEIAMLDCLGFLRHFLHFFHRFRLTWLNHYQELVIAEPDSAVSPELKEAFLALRLAAEMGK